MPRLTLTDLTTFRVGFGMTLYHHIEKNADGSPLRARVTGKLKQWRRPHSPQWQLPVKHGLKGSFYINETTVEDWFTHEDEARLFHHGVSIHKVEAMQVWQISVATTRQPETYSSYGEALSLAVKRHLPVSAPKWIKPWAIVEVQLDGRAVIGELVSFPTHDRTIMVRLIPGLAGSAAELPLTAILRPAAKFKWVHYAEVSGKYGFPIDMLRYDSCHPVNFTVAPDGLPILEEGWPPEARLLVGAASTTRNRSPFTLARWESFAWTCLPTRTDKIGAING